MSEPRLTNQVFVTLVGRPNVGKSTLFNKLVGEERAITGKESGVTRDRISEDLEWDNVPFTLLDTAGFRSEHPAPDHTFILRQVESMIDRSDCLLFVVDAQQGITELDRQIARKLYSVSERVLLVVNKVDPPSNEEVLKSDFYELGFPEIVGVSAQHEVGLDGVKEWVTNNLNEVVSDGFNRPPSDDLTRISLVGRPNTGKSTLFNSILGYERVMVSDKPGTTRDYVSVSFDFEGRRFRLIDTGGLIRKNKVGGALEQEIVYGSLQSINYSDVVCLVLDWTERVTHQDQRIAGLIKDRHRGCIILVNKADQFDEAGEQNWLDHLKDRLFFLDYAPVLFTSGRESRGLGAIFRTGFNIHSEMKKRFENEKLKNVLLDLKSKISWPGSEASNVVLRKLEQTDVDPVTLEIQASHPEYLGENDLRYLSRLIRNKLDIEISPVKLIVTQDDLDG